MQELINKVGSIFVVIPVGAFYILIGLVMLAALSLAIWAFARAFILPLYDEKKESHTKPRAGRNRRTEDFRPQEQ